MGFAPPPLESVRMSKLSLSERARIAALSVDRSRRSALSRLLASPGVRWTFGPAAADQLLIVPQDLRTADPSFWRELRHGQMGLAGSAVALGGLSPFDVAAPRLAWERSLHGFGWLRHLAAAEKDEARDMARRLALDWAKRQRGGSTFRFDAAVRGRRLISWLSHTNLLLEGADQRTYDAIADSLGRQAQLLSATWRDVPPGHARLLALVALTLADLCISGHESQLGGVERVLSTELGLQIFDDGGHVSRNPLVPMELLLDLLPLRQCFNSRGRAVPAALDTAIARMLPFVRQMRLGDGMPGRFNGVGVASPAAQATVLAYEDAAATVPQLAADSGYVRLVRGDAIVLADVGAAPPLEHAGEAHAGCLSFELSVGTRLVFVNGGAPSTADAGWRPASRATASHNTLSLAEQSSSRLVRHPVLESLIGSAPIRAPDRVTVALNEMDDGGLTLEAAHDGYLARFGLLHTRTLELSADGRRLAGHDLVEGPGRTPVRLRDDVPLAVHFHLHPSVVCRHGETPKSVLLTAGDVVLRFASETLPVAVEESVHFADSSGPVAALQLVLRDLTRGGTQVRWSLERIDAPRAARARSAPASNVDADNQPRDTATTEPGAPEPAAPEPAPTESSPTDAGQAATAAEPATEPAPESLDAGPSIANQLATSTAVSPPSDAGHPDHGAPVVAPVEPEKPIEPGDTVDR